MNKYLDKTNLTYFWQNLKQTFVKKEDGKFLSSNDYTDEDKIKLRNIEENAQINVQSDWNQTDDTQDDYIKNKPTEMTAEDIDAMMDTNRIISMSDLLFDEYGAYFELTLDLQEDYADSTLSAEGESEIVPTLVEGTIYIVNTPNLGANEHSYNIQLINNSNIVDSKYCNIREYYKSNILNGKASDFNMSDEKFEAYRVLIREMLELCAEGQIWNGYTLDNLANKNLPDNPMVFEEIVDDGITVDTLVPADPDNPNVDGNRFKSGSIEVHNSKMNIMVNLVAATMENFTVKITDSDNNIQTVNLADIPLESGYPVIKVCQKTNNFDKANTFELFKGDMLCQTLTFNIARSCKTKQNKIDAEGNLTSEAKVSRRIYTYCNAYRNYINTP